MNNTTRLVELRRGWQTACEPSLEECAGSTLNRLPNAHCWLGSASFSFLSGSGTTSSSLLGRMKSSDHAHEATFSWRCGFDTSQQSIKVAQL